MRRSATQPLIQRLRTARTDFAAHGNGLPGTSYTRRSTIALHWGLSLPFRVCAWARWILVWIALIWTTAVPAGGEPLVLGIFPRRSPEVTREAFAPIARYLGSRLHREVQLETSYDMFSFWQNVVAGRYDIVHYNQYHYVRSHAEYGYRVILKNEEYGRSTISGAIMVRTDSGIEALNDLRGRKIVFGGGRNAMISHIVARYLLREAGLDDVDYITRFALTPSKACLTVYYRQAAAGGVGDVVLEFPSIRNSIDTSELRLLAVSEPLAHLPWAVNPRMPLPLAKQIQTILANMDANPGGRSVLRRAGLTGLRVAEDADYDTHRHIIRVVVHEDY